jgi:hypothetical protein
MELIELFGYTQRGYRAKLCRLTAALHMAEAIGPDHHRSSSFQTDYQWQLTSLGYVGFTITPI